MASATLTVSPAAPAKGAVVTATYSVSGNDATPAQTATVTGRTTIGSQDIDVSTTITLPGAPALPETFAAPTCPGLTFAATANPRVFTAVA